jgi:hypothetical protein
MEPRRQRKSFFLGFVLGCTIVLVFVQYRGISINELSVAHTIYEQGRLPIVAPTSPTRAAAANVYRYTLPNGNSSKTFRNHTYGPDDHPHAGARDENGTWPYIPDVEEVRRTVLQRIQNDPDYSTNPHHYLPLDPDSTVCQEAPGKGFEGPFGYKALREYVQVDGPDPATEESGPIEETDLATRESHHIRWRDGPPRSSSHHNVSVVGLPRVLCSVYTSENSHGNIRDIAETWGWRCDGFLAASTKTNRSIGAVDLPHEGPEEYGNMWQKTRSMVAFMYDYYLEDYDYFLLCGDDTYVIVENLRNYLLLLESETGGRNARPLYIGNSIALFDVYYNTGGPGYLLNRAALRLLVEDGLPYYFAHHRSPGEDVIMGDMMTVLHIHSVDTSDVANRQRFFHDDLNAAGSPDSPPSMFNYLTYKHGVRSGRNAVSTQAVGFHMITSMKRFSAILYNACPEGTVLGDAQQSGIKRRSSR